MGAVRDFKFGVGDGMTMFQPDDEKSSQKRAWLESRDPF